LLGGGRKGSAAAAVAPVAVVPGLLQAHPAVLHREALRPSCRALFANYLMNYSLIKSSVEGMQQHSAQSQLRHCSRRPCRSILQEFSAN
jgi:hypothetical protein